jgi:hypothetical protein
MRRAIANALISLTSMLLGLVALEFILRAYPLLLGDTYANGVLSKYANRWLPRDGHLSPAGARRLAELESAFLRGVDPSPR